MHTATDAPTHPGTANGPWRTGARFLQDRLARPLGVLVLLAALATLSYSNTFSASFHFDDTPNIVENPQIRSFSAFRDLSGSRYIGFLTFAVNYHVGGLQVAGYHLVNLAIHMTNGWLVYTLVGLLLRTPGLGAASVGLSPRQAQGVALTTALLFVVHPIQTQAITYLVQRFTSLATLWYLLAVVCYLHWRLTKSGPRPWSGWYAGALAATLLAMKTKEISFTLPFLLVLVEGLGFPRPRGTRWGALLPFLFTLLIIPLSLPGGLGETAAGFARETTDISRLSYFFTQCRVLVTYLRLLIWPVHQNLDYDYPHYDSLLQAPVFLSGLLLLGLAGLALYLVLASTRWRLVGFGVLWFFLTLAVESSLIPIRDVIYEHRLYLPSVGIFLAGSLVAATLLGRWRMISVIALGVMVALLAMATYQRNQVWHDEVSLWTNVVAQSPMKARGYNDLGYAYAEQGRWDDAIKEYRTALRLDFNYSKSHINLGNAYFQQGRLDEAITELKVSIQLYPEFSPLLFNSLGAAYAEQGRWEEAIQHYILALQRKPDFPEAHSNLGWAYAHQGRLEDASAELVTALRLKPDAPEAHNNLGVVYARQKRWEEAIQHYTLALQFRPDFAEAHQSLGAAYAGQGRWDAAIHEYQIALTLTPHFAKAHYDLGTAYTHQGQWAAAIEEFVTALQQNPNFPEAHNNLGGAYAHLERWEDAIHEYQTVIALQPTAAGAHYNLGLLYQLRGRRAEARQQFETVLRLQPDFAPAQHALNALDLPPNTHR